MCVSAYILVNIKWLIAEYIQCTNIERVRTSEKIWTLCCYKPLTLHCCQYIGNRFLFVISFFITLNFTNCQHTGIWILRNLSLWFSIHNQPYLSLKQRVSLVLLIKAILCEATSLLASILLYGIAFHRSFNYHKFTLYICLSREFELSPHHSFSVLVSN